MKDIFNYPADYETILRKTKKIKRELLNNTGLKEKRIAILGGSTTAKVKEVLEVFLLSKSIMPVFYESDYNKYYEDALFSEELVNFNPDIVYIHSTIKNISYKPDIKDSNEIVDRKINNEFEKYKEIWESLNKKLNCTIIQNNFEYPEYRSLGNLDATNIAGYTRFVNNLNHKFYDYIDNNSNILLNDINYLASYIGLENWYDNTLWFNYKYAISYIGIAHLSHNLSNIINSLYGGMKKSLVLDLDNTMWGGIIGDDGVDNIKLGQGSGVGEAHQEFQKYIKELSSRGIVLNICSKNEHENAIAGINHPEMILKEDDFLIIKANWDMKSQNISNIAKEMNVGENSLVFIDDNPTERELVKNYLNDVEVPNIGNDPSLYIKAIDKSGYFESIAIQKDDFNRNKQYKDNLERENLKTEHQNYDDFLRSLEMVCDISDFKDIYLDRITQLTNKTNQFNMTTKRCTRQEIEEYKNSNKKIAIYGRLKDKFGDNGLISLIAGSINDKSINIDLWLMSCRVFKRKFEYEMFDNFVEKCKEKNIDVIYGYYLPTKKNIIIKDLYKELGFTLDSNEDGKETWKLDINNYNKFNYKLFEKESY